MKADFSRDSFDPAKHYSRVLQQQGRVMLDADANEQSQIQQYHLRTLARDLIGAYGAPQAAPGFKLALSISSGGVANSVPDLQISAGRMYVHGLMLENESGNVSYFKQPDYTPPVGDGLSEAWDSQGARAAFLYLDVSERLVTALDDAQIREPALAGIDTCQRSKLVWQVKSALLEMDGNSLQAYIDERSSLQSVAQALRWRTENFEQQMHLSANPQFTLYIPGQPSTDHASWERLVQSSREHLSIVEARLQELPAPCQIALQQLQAATPLGLYPKLMDQEQYDSPCLLAPEAAYRGMENHLYRIEIHQVDKEGKPLFWKWSRDNGSLCVALLGLDSAAAAGPGMYALKVDSSRGFAAGDWVEVLDADQELEGSGGQMLRLVRVEPGVLVAEMAAGLEFDLPAPSQRPRVRRWDQRGSKAEENGGVLKFEDDGKAQDVEDGLQICFNNGTCRAGDYWMIPMRVGQTRITDWPLNADGRIDFAAPHGVRHYYAPLGFARRDGNKWDVSLLNSCYRIFQESSEALRQPPPAPSNQPFPSPSGAPEA
ncbi:DUF6519 domain-containing protein [Massilia sp. W12]|uniref:DUF6519 domain-containing protein n=1 Tax=Massilia sp. W12 TaxID=3126507 RepID=UPI0030CCC6B7